MADKSVIDDGNFLQENLTQILEDVLRKSERENPFKQSIFDYHQASKLLNDPTSLQQILRKIKRANSKIIDEIKIMEELERKEEEKKARDQAEAERAEKIQKELLEMHSLFFGPNEMPNVDEPNKLKEKVSDAVSSHLEMLHHFKEALTQLA